MRTTTATNIINPIKKTGSDFAPGLIINMIPKPVAEINNIQNKDFKTAFRLFLLLLFSFSILSALMV